MGRVALVLGLALSACATGQSTARLEHTYWKLLHAGGVASVVDESRREPHLVLHGARRTLAGYTGCNRFSTGYALDGAALVFTAPVALPAMCTEPLAARQERLLMQALERTARWRVAGERLELLDEAGQVLAGFEAVYLR